MSPVLSFPLLLSSAVQLCSAVLHAWMASPTQTQTHLPPSLRQGCLFHTESPRTAISEPLGLGRAVSMVNTIWPLTAWCFGTAGSSRSSLLPYPWGSPLQERWDVETGRCGHAVRQHRKVLQLHWDS